MKINDVMRYPHPVLSDSSPDFNASEFHCSFEQQLTQDGKLKVSSDLVLRCPDISALINTQRAATGYFVICRPTYFNFLQPAPLAKVDSYFDAAKFFGAVVIRPAIWTLSEVKRFSSPHMNAEFGRAVSIPKGAIIALGPEFRFSVDKKKFKPFESIFELAAQAGLEPGTIEVDPLRERITISAEPETHKSLASMRNMPAGRDMLLNCVYLPAIIDVLAALQGAEEDFTGKNWYRVFKAKCDDLGIDPASSKQTPLVMAQKLLRAPLKRVIALAEKA
jgi:hypothetical protein